MGREVWWLLATGRVNLYLSTRTAWVVPVGAVLTAAALGRLAAARTAGPERLTRREAAIMTLMVVPVVLVTLLPPATLGSFSASRKTEFLLRDPLEDVRRQDHDGERDHPAHPGGGADLG